MKIIPTVLAVLKMSFLRKAEEGQRLPSGYGYAWYKLETREKVGVPIPLNWLCRFIALYYHEWLYRDHNARTYRLLEMLNRGYEFGSKK